MTDTVYTAVEEQYLVRSDTAFISVVDRVERVKGGERRYIPLALPPNTRGWSYYVGVGHQGAAVYEAAQNDFVRKAATGGLTLLGMDPTGASFLAALALDSYNYTQRAVDGEDVHFAITNRDEASHFLSGREYRYFRGGRVVNAAGRLEGQIADGGYLNLHNDNLFTSIDVQVKVLAVVVEQEVATRIVQIPKVMQRWVPVFAGVSLGQSLR